MARLLPQQESVHPDYALTISMWIDGHTCLFQTKNERGDIVLDQGKMTFV